MPGKNVTCRWVAKLLAVTACLVITACSGGGGGGSSTAPSAASPVTNPTPGNNSPSFPTEAELNANYGLDDIDSRTAYAAGATGKGTTVAVIDSGIDTDHVELENQFTNSSFDIVTNSRETIDDVNGHGTHIAGIIAAKANGQGGVGIAYNAKILAIRADLRNQPSCAPGDCFSDADVARAINYAIDNGAKVINLSLGRRGTLSSSFVDALERAASRGILVVAAGGNEGGSLIAPADLAANSNIGGHLIAAGAAGQGGSPWSSNSTPSTDALAERFLLAPGVSIQSTYNDGGYRRLTGTSMATAHISAAAAVLKDRFPSLSMAQIAEILLVSAENRGPEGTDRQTGRGFLDLGNAVKPIGNQSVPTGMSVSGPSVSLASTSMSLGAAFGDALSNSRALNQAMFLDGYDRPYRVDLSDRVQSDARRLHFESLLFDNTDVISINVPSDQGALGIAMNVAYKEGDQFDHAHFNEPTTSLRSSAIQEQEFHSAQLSRQLGQSTRIDVGTGLSTSWLASQDHVERSANQLFLGSGEHLSPTGAILDRGHGIRIAHQLEGGTTLQVGFVDGQADLDDLNDDEGASGRMMRAAIQHRFDKASIRLGFSFLDEEESLLGSTGSGGFAMGSGSQSQFLDATARWSFTPNIHAIGQATLGYTQMGSDGGMIDDWSNVYSNAFAMGLVAEQVARPGDRIGLLLSQPLRVSSASATADVATSRDLDGNVQRNREQVDMSPSGREMNLQLAYSTPIAPESTVGSWVMLRSEPGHDSQAPLDLGIGVKLAHRF